MKRIGLDPVLILIISTVRVVDRCRTAGDPNDHHTQAVK